MKAWMMTKKRTVTWLNQRSRVNPQRFVNRQNQIVKTVKWLNQQLRGSPQRVRYNVNGRLRFETDYFVRILTLKKLCKSVFFSFVLAILMKKVTEKKNMN